MSQHNPARALLLINYGASRAEASGGDIGAQLSRYHEVHVEDMAEIELDDYITRCGDAYDVIYVAGGDGSLNLALEELIKAGKPVGIIPLGTANDFARTLQIPLEPLRAVDVLASGEIHEVDVGCVNGHLFVNVASIGLAASVAREMDANEKNLFGVLSYPLALARAYWNARPLRVRLTIDGKRHRVYVLQMGVGNGHSHGGGLYVSEDVSVRDGQFDIYCVIAPSFWRLTHVLFALLSRSHRFEPALKTYRAEKVEIETSRKVDINVDGELLTETPARFRVLPLALKVLTPAGWNEEPTRTAD